MAHPTPAKIKLHLARKFAEDARSNDEPHIPSRALRIAMEAVSEAVKEAEHNER